MGTIFFSTWLAQSLNNWRVFNDEQRDHGEKTVSWGRYLLDPDLWERTLQNWQSDVRLAPGGAHVAAAVRRRCAGG